MEWLKNTEVIELELSPVDKTNAWTASAELKLADVPYTVEVGLFSDEIKSRISMKTPIKSCLWSIKLQQTTTFIPRDVIKKKCESTSTFQLDTNKSSQETCLSTTKDLKLDVENIDKESMISIQIELKVIDSYGIHNQSNQVIVNRLNSTSDVSLMVENKEVRANKGFLSTLSYHFCSLFNGDFKEKNSGKVELKEVSYEEFAEFMRILHGIHNNVNEHNYVYLLALSDRFQVPSITRMCEEYMLTLRKFYVNGNFSERMAALLLSEKYHLPKIQELVLSSINTLMDLKKVMKQKEFLELCDASKAFILQHSVASLAG